MTLDAFGVHLIEPKEVPPAEIDTSGLGLEDPR
jgi:hypothetical protein